MGTGAEPAKGLLPYLQRADELQKHEPLVAYYCRLYAMEKGLVIPPKDRTKMTNSILVSLINQLEKDKKSLTLGPDDHLHLEGFASSVFAKADKQDRAGRADINTAKTFYAASIFFEILSQFGEVQPDLEQKQKYAIWKAAEIRKALKEGRKPEAGPPGGDKDEAPDNTTTYTQDIGRSQSFGSSQNGNGAPSQSVDKDFSRRDSFSPVQPGNVPSRQGTEKFNDHVSPQAHFAPPPPPPASEFSSPQSQFSPPPPSSYSSPSYQGADYPPPDTHTPHPNYSSASYPTTDYPANEVHKPPSNYSPPPYTRTDHPSDDNYNPQSNDKPDISAYPHTYQQPPYTVEPQHTSQNYYATETPPAPYNYPNFQSYPSFHETTLPSVTTHQPPYHPTNDGATAPSYSPSASNHPAPMQYQPRDEATHHQVSPAVAAAAAPPASQYMYDSSYQPAVEKIAEAHKAARFAVGALAFDDVSIAVEHLKRALDLLTNPSAETH
ncbi:hypothetical protein QYE76_029563 [Lolium multiflorum]|uniref:Uncharacterized protein n=1 Tax=Lolium multiflorum TaxID=4521 RepID=A0AAD8QP71_LOLMU|nr:hypothetical protein QYE76_029563 [Lolium multiflorum]